MPHYLLQAAFKDTAMKRLVEHPQPREDVVRKAAESLGGRVLQFYFCFGEYDAMAVVEFPNNEAAMANSLAVSAGGAVTKFHTTTLVTPEEAVRAMQAAGKATYTPPS
jgi:uncharacterized protein with GYD domain